MLAPIFDSDKIYTRLSTLTGGLLFPPVILCIGSDRVTGDCFGPLVGEYLTRGHNVDTFVYGSLSKTVTALNLAETALFIKARHKGRAVIAVDSALGIEKDLGSFRVFYGGLYPGAAVGKVLPKVGDFSLTATVAQNGAEALNGVKLGFVSQLARTAAKEISRCLAAFTKVSAARQATFYTP